MPTGILRVTTAAPSNGDSPKWVPLFTTTKRQLAAQNRQVSVMLDCHDVAKSAVLFLFQANYHEQCPLNPNRGEQSKTVTNGYATL